MRAKGMELRLRLEVGGWEREKGGERKKERKEGRKHTQIKIFSLHEQRTTNTKK